jgi:hypothetical protein
MSKIKAYAAEVAAVSPRGAGFNQEAKSFTKKFDDSAAVCDVLDTMTLAAEAGELDTAGFVEQVFQDSDSFDAFLEEFASYDECYRINDRWYNMLKQVIGFSEEEGFVTSRELSAALRQHAERTDQM